MEDETNYELKTINLSFKNPEIEKKFRADYFKRSISIFRISYVLVVILFASFGHFDFIVTSEHIESFFVVRMFIILPVLILTFILSFTKFFFKIWQSLLMYCFIISGLGVVYMISKIPSNPYYFSGIFLINLAGFFFIRLRFFRATIAAISNVIVYVIFMMSVGAEVDITDVDIFISVSFYGAMVLLGASAAYYIERLERIGFAQKAILRNQQAEIANSNDLLEQKVIDRTNEIAKSKKVIEESEKKYKTLYENAPLAYQSLSSEGELLDVNPRWCSILRYDKSEVVGRCFSEFLHDDSVKYFKQQFPSFLKKGYITNAQYKMIRKDHTELIAEFEGMVGYFENGEVKQTYCTFKDITTEFEIKEELIKAKIKAEEGDRLKSAFLANMSHEIRTPMNGILGFASLLHNDLLDNKSRNEYVEIIIDSGQRLLNTVNDIIDISQIESGQVEVFISKTDIVRELDKLLTFFELEAKKKGLEIIIEKHIEDSSLAFFTDSFKFSAIVSNLIKNAIKFTHKGTITVGCTLTDNQLNCFVKDTGIGIPEDKQKAIFNRFEQAEVHDRREYEGSGLGLAISKSYIEMLNGELWLESMPEKGSTFFFNIPNNIPMD